MLPRIGGQEWVVDNLARGFQAQGHTVVVLAPRGQGWVRGCDAQLPYRMVRHPPFRSTRWFVASYGWWLARLHRRHACDVVHCHSVHPTGYVAARCTAVDDVPLVISSHGGDIDDVSPLYRKRGLAEHYRQAIRRADALVAVSEFIEGRLRQWCETDTRIARIPHGVDLQQYAATVSRPAELDPRIQPGKYFLFLGRTVRRKGVDLLLDAFKMVGADNPMHLVIAGEGTDRAALEARAGALGLGRRVTFLKCVQGNTKTWLLQHALCNVVPSRHSEAFGLTALESLASGRPIIAAAVPGLRELVVPERNGILVPPESVQELARTLHLAIDRPEWFDQLGTEALQTAQTFTWDKAVQRHLELFEERRRRVGKDR